jgi:heme-degrading monooxygenase HmoA
MIVRIWNGYTTKQNADSYEALLKNEIFIEIEQKLIKGYRGIQLLRRETEHETIFTTMMWFESIDSIIAFSGTDYEKAYVPEKAKVFLIRFDERAIHCELKCNFEQIRQVAT